MKILIIGPDTIENKQLIREARKRKHQTTLASIKNFSFISKNGAQVLFLKNKKIALPDVCLVRGSAPADAEARIVANFLSNKGVRIIDRKLVEKPYELHKLGSTLILENAGSPAVPTFYFATVTEFRRHLSKLPKELVIKPIDGRKSRGLKAVSKSDARAFFTPENIHQYIIQPKLGDGTVIRVFVIGKKAVAHMVKRGKFVDKTQPKRSVSHADAAALKVAVKATEAMDLEITGVDLLENKGKIYVLEVNRAPGFSALSEFAGINIAEKIIQYIEK